MTNTIPNVPRELLERVLNAGWGSETVNALDDLRDFLESAPSPANHVEDVRAMVAEPVQQVIVPDGWKLVPVELTPEMIDASADLDVEPFDNIDDELCAIYAAMIAAAPAAPAVDACGVLEQAMYTLISIGYHENSGLVHELRQALAANRSKGAM